MLPMHTNLFSSYAKISVQYIQTKNVKHHSFPIHDCRYK
jgi:hypothetical protein